MYINICRHPFISCYSFHYNMVGKTLWFFLQYRIRNCGVTENIFVISKELGLSIYWNSHHAQFVLDLNNTFTKFFHGNKFTTKIWTLVTSLFNWHPIYWRDVHIYYKTCSRPSCDCITSMVCINPLRNQKPKPRGVGMFGGRYSLLETWKNSHDLQSWFSHSDWSITWLLGSIISLEFCYFLSYAHILYS